jgi:acyl-CoA dehydrogenase
MSAGNDVRNMLIDAATRVFADHVDAKLLDAAKRDGWSTDLWRVVSDAELTLVGIAEDRGGAGGTLSDQAAVLRVASRYAAPIPLAETALAAWLLTEAGLPIPAGPLTVAPVRSETINARRDGDVWRISGKLARVPFARVSNRLVVLTAVPEGTLVAAIDPAHCQIVAGGNLAFEPRDNVELDNTVAEAAALTTKVTPAALRLRGALARSLQIAGALEAALELSVRYAGERVQFGRKIAQFQSIQHELARFAGEVAAAVGAAMSAAGILERGESESSWKRNGDAHLAVASAKIRCSRAAQEGSMIAHQVHGAIGFTDRYALHHATLRLWSWREEFGNEAVWAQELGGAIAAAGADRLWPALSGN